MKVDRNVAALLNKTGKSAPHYTHGISVVGNGSMKDGLIKFARTFYEGGKQKGRLEGAGGTAGIFGALYMAYKLRKRKKGKDMKCLVNQNKEDSTRKRADVSGDQRNGFES